MVLAGLVMGATAWYWIDSVVSLVIVVVIMGGTVSLLRESLSLALDAVPKSIDPASVECYLADLLGVIAVHDLHIWGLSTMETALTVHLVSRTRPWTMPYWAGLTRNCERDMALLTRPCSSNEGMPSIPAVRPPKRCFDRLRIATAPGKPQRLSSRARNFGACAGLTLAKLSHPV